MLQDPSPTVLANTADLQRKIAKRFGELSGSPRPNRYRLYLARGYVAGVSGAATPKLASPSAGDPSHAMERIDLMPSGQNRVRCPKRHSEFVGGFTKTLSLMPLTHQQDGHEGFPALLGHNRELYLAALDVENRIEPKLKSLASSFMFDYSSSLS